MFEKFNKINNKNLELTKSQYFEDKPIQQDLISNSKIYYHVSHATLAKLTTIYDNNTRRNMDQVASLAFQGNIDGAMLYIKKGEEIANFIKDYTKVFIKLNKVFKRALLHYCFYDIINEKQ